MSEHTPGPWRVDGTVALGPYFVVTDNPSVEQELSIVCAFDVCRRPVNGKAHAREQIEANARLIAAAPDLLAAARAILGDVARYRERGGTLTEREEANVKALADVVAKATPPPERRPAP